MRPSNNSKLICKYNLYKKKLIKNLIKYYKYTLGLKDVEKRIEDRIRRVRAKNTMNKLSKVTSLKNKLLLDVGSGWGEFTYEARRRGAIAYGIEPDPELLDISSTLISGVFVRGVAEYLPFKDETFDILICYTVLEHVMDVEKSIKEMLRVLKRGGILYLVVPNYMFPYEGHYKIWWIPMMPKIIAKLYLKLINRPNKFIEHINYTTAIGILNELKKYKVKIINLTLNNIMKNYNYKPLFIKLIIKLITKLHMYPILEVIVIKE